MKQIILASASPRRQDILKQIKVDFIVKPSDVDENIDEIEGTPADKAKELALRKAKHIANDIESGIVIGADTIVVLGNKIFGKSLNVQDAYSMISQLNNTTHQVITGVAIIDGQKVLVDQETTNVTFSKLTDNEIRNYLDTGEYLGKAGSYGIQGMGSLLVKKIDGCYFNVVGLPIYKLKSMLQSFGLSLL